MFDLKDKKIRGLNIFDLIQKFNYFPVDTNLLKSCVEKVRNSSQTFHFEKKFSTKERYFNIEINSIISDGNFLGTLILFK